MKNKPIYKTRNISNPIQNLLWGKAAGFCQFKGCPNSILQHHVTHKTVNLAEKAHIYAFSEGGERHNDQLDGEELNGLDNLLLLCGSCHTQIDVNGGAVDFPVEVLQKWKRDHEARVERLMKIDPGNSAEIVLYKADIAKGPTLINYDLAAAALMDSDSFPAEDKPFDIQSPPTHLKDDDPLYWNFFEKDLLSNFDRKIRDILANQDSPLAVFALAPQPLLIKLGTLLTDIPEIDVYQCHREPKGWAWPNKNQSLKPTIIEPDDTDFPPVLVVSLTAEVNRCRVESALEEKHSIWEITIPSPNHGCIRSQKDLVAFKKSALSVIEEIQRHSAQDVPLKIFPVSPNAPMVELGRIRQSNAHKPWIIYNQNRSLGGFIETLTIK